MRNNSLPAAYIQASDRLNVIATLLEAVEYLLNDPKSQDIAYALLEYARDLAKYRQDLEEVHYE
ncbi:MAG: hypothetical protein RAM36_00760 [Arsenophonus sp.]|nr:hypothetical protein [Arsenophonus sp.]